MRVRLMIFLLLMLPGLAHAQLSAAQLHAVRTQAFSVCSYLLAYYNPNQDAADVRHADSYREGMQRLQQLVRWDSNLDRLVDEMAHSIDGLEAVPPEQPELYPGLLTPALRAQAELDLELAQRAVRISPSSAEMATMQELRLDIERSLLLYQTRAFGLLSMYVLVVDEDTVAQLDTRILQGFADVRAQHAQHRAELARLQGYYTYMRPHLFARQRAWVPSSAVYYLQQASMGLAGLLPE